jgi:hypothetical protein
MTNAQSGLRMIPAARLCRIDFDQQGRTHQDRGRPEPSDAGARAGPFHVLM